MRPKTAPNHFSPLELNLKIQLVEIPPLKGAKEPRSLTAEVTPKFWTETVQALQLQSRLQEQLTLILILGLALEIDKEMVYLSN